MLVAPFFFLSKCNQFVTTFSQWRGISLVPTHKQNRQASLAVAAILEIFLGTVALLLRAGTCQYLELVIREPAPAVGNPRFLNLAV